jgi:hypothetical protein
MNDAGVYDERTGDRDAGTLVTQMLQLKTLPVSKVMAQLNTLGEGNGKVILSRLGSGNMLMLSGYSIDASHLKTLT